MGIFEIWDRTVAGFAHGVLQSCGAFATPFFMPVSVLGNGGAAFIAVAIILLLFRRTRKAGTAALFALMFGAILTNLILKNIVARERPFTDEGSIYYIYWQNAGGQSGGGRIFLPVRAHNGGDGLCRGAVYRGRQKIFMTVSVHPAADGFFPHIFCRALLYRRAGRLCRRRLRRRCGRVAYKTADKIRILFGFSQRERNYRIYSIDTHEETMSSPQCPAGMAAAAK